MRRWLKRGFWLAAWSFWLWLGFGLHRELPRDLGPVVCELPLRDSEREVGFLGGSGVYLSLAKDSDTSATTLRYRNAKTGELIKDIPGPLEPIPYPSWSLDAGFMFGRRPDASNEWDFLNLFTGGWIGANLKTKVIPNYQPWGSLVLIQSFANGIGDVAVLDGEGHRVFQRHLTSEQVHRWASAFFIGEDRIGLCFVPASSPQHHIVEVWKLNANERPLQVVEGVHIDASAMTARNGRVAWRGDLGPRVFDFDIRQLVFDRPGNMNTQLGWGPLISPDGRRVLGANQRQLWDVESGKCIWSAGDDQKPHWEARAQHLGAFEVWEEWKVEFDDWSKEESTIAVRDLSTGRLRFRCWEPVCTRDNMSSDGRMYWRYDNVHVLPPAASYPLLALCQTILALPLILLWLFLRWRRNRRLRSSGVQP